ncbi:MAG: hypothetical protein OER90_09955 [Gemmatimonadota bacterium]|nr:hypothetical protein [Gemmatimonadota bacterium]
MISTRVALLVALASLTHAAGIVAQSRVTGGIGVTGGLVSVEREIGAVTEELSGTVFGAEGAIRFWRVELSGRYVQGAIDTDPATEAFDFVEGELLLGVRPVRPVLLGFGPHVRSWVEPTGTIRWSHWVVRARIEAPLLAGGLLQSFVEGWYAVSGSVNAPNPFQLGRGLAGGLGLTIPSTPLHIQLAYRVDRGALDTQARIETVEQLSLRVGIGR